MHPKLFLLTTLLIASPLPALAACKSTRSVSGENNQEARILVPFAIPIDLPVATFAPYFYSASQFQPVTPLALPEERRREAAQTRASNFELPSNFEFRASNLQSPRSPQNLPAAAGLPPSPLTTHCSSCHSGPSPKAGLSLDHPDILSLADRLRAIRAIASGQMPKGAQLTNDEIRTLIQELTHSSP